MLRPQQIEYLNKHTSLKWAVAYDTGGLVASGEFYKHWLDEIPRFNIGAPVMFCYSHSNTFAIIDNAEKITIETAASLVNMIENSSIPVLEVEEIREPSQWEKQLENQLLQEGKESVFDPSVKKLNQCVWRGVE